MQQAYTVWFGACIPKCTGGKVRVRGDVSYGICVCPSGTYEENGQCKKGARPIPFCEPGQSGCRIDEAFQSITNDAYPSFVLCCRVCESNQPHFGDSSPLSLFVLIIGPTLSRNIAEEEEDQTSYQYTV
jgi:hypothetical protein